MSDLIKQSGRSLLSLLRASRGLILILFLFLIASSLLAAFVIWPAYKNPGARMYDSGLGYAALMRKLGKPFPVVTAEVKERPFTRAMLAEATCSADPYLVPVIPMATVAQVHIEEGDFVEKGQLLLELDPIKAEIKLESARLALATAEAELQRVRVGSAYVLAQERPDREKINVEAARQLSDQATDKVARYREAAKRGLIAQTTLLEAEKEFTSAVQEKELAELFLKMSTQGVKESEVIALNAVKDAREAVRHREEELADHKTYSPVSGVVERILIRPGEYNQDAGKPGLVIAAGLWFDGYFDQADFPWLQQGQEGLAYLESYPGRPLPIRVQRIVPIVTFNEGGPEINRPLRPRGTGAPEWAATFSAELEFINTPEDLALAPGMTGFARIESTRTSLAVPREALLSIAAGKAIVEVITGENKRESRAVSIGMVDHEAAEILSGLTSGERVIAEGHWGLKSEDEIEIVGTDGWN
ncbi:HlyD family efflux transporter periplasmic adaptor subunit [Roseibacillus ishigakijimensis]|uniref:HlyD family efflux transporter periplasmic adaptor subunit n=1 Tax=Roseibacillus ishigakijimensis TaxID=454146 RepID=A0A934VKV8_9BACT|nr:HlyD family efflux transporter periplasmic adaptor subunit [Roseibacillus ishigakijimensis]MBK1832577.1 HlyD family efflux transporter periplasmic adaptor subunit [Roseibacillus ishigakijimensis]